jgi:HK97 gp10 family phage protein
MAKTRLEWFGDKAKVKGRNVMNKSVYEIGVVIQGQAIALTPVDTGRLRNSIVTRTLTKDNGKAERKEDEISKPTKENVARVGTNVEYAEYIEYGTRYQTAQPYLRPAFDLAQGKTLTIVIKNGRREFEGF